MISESLRLAYQLAAAQHSVVATWQLAEVGLSAKQRSELLRQGRLDRLSSQVLAVPGAAPSDGRRVMAGVLDAGRRAVLSHSSAAAWWTIPGFDLETIHVSRHYGASGRKVRLGTLHELRDLPERLLTVLNGVLVVRPELALFQLAGMVGFLRLERAVENAWAMRLVDGKQLRRVLALMRDRGREGTVSFREVVVARPEDYVPPASNAEARFAQILEDDGQAPMRRQVEMGGEDWVGIVDFGDDTRPFVVEILSERYHAALIDRKRDAERFAALRRSGRVVVAFWDYQLWRQGRHVAMVVRRVRSLVDAGVPPDSPLLEAFQCLHELTANGSRIEAYLADRTDGGPPDRVGSLNLLPAARPCR